MVLNGRVIEEQKNYFIVDTPTAGQITATTGGALKASGSKVYTGDIVDVKVIEKSPPKGIITSVNERSSLIKRPAVANCSHILCTFTYKEPQLNLEFLDRLLFNTHAHNLQPVIVFNKTDLLSAKEKDAMYRIIDVYSSAGYEVFTASAVNREGVGDIVDFCKGRITAFAGPSGVGKSALLSVIFPDTDFRIGRLSSRTQRGTHTTTNVRLLKLSSGGYIADTPGLSFIDPVAIPEEDVVLYFPELTACIGSCRYNDCIHVKEPGCSVPEKKEKGEIAPWRHDNYLKLYKEMVEKRKKKYRKSG